jgi:hypothetical protein
LSSTRSSAPKPGRSLSAGRLWASDLLVEALLVEALRVEALRVADDDASQPVAPVRGRLRRWADAAGAHAELKPPVCRAARGSYVIFAAAALA